LDAAISGWIRDAGIAALHSGRGRLCTVRKHVGYDTLLLVARAGNNLGFCLSNAMHSIGQSIKSPERPCVHPCVQLMRRHISITVQDGRTVTMDHL